MAMELKTKNQRLAPQANCFPLPGVPNVEVVLRHFHRSCYRSAVVLLWGRHLASWLLAIDEHSRLEDLRGSGRRSIIPYVHRRTELYCSSMYEPETFLFSTPRKWRPPEPFVA
jgi:hypothetical protein